MQLEGRSRSINSQLQISQDTKSSRSSTFLFAFPKLQMPEISMCSKAQRR